MNVHKLYSRDCVYYNIDGNYIETDQPNLFMYGLIHVVTGGLPNTLQYVNMTGMSDSACRSAWSTNYNSAAHLCLENNVNANGAGACNVSWEAVKLNI